MSTDTGIVSSKVGALLRKKRIAEAVNHKLGRKAAGQAIEAVWDKVWTSCESRVASPVIASTRRDQ